MALLRYITGRLIASFLVLWGVSVVIFGLARLIPGDPVRIAMGPMASKEQVEAMRLALGLDEAIWVQYWQFLKGVSRGDLGVSLYTKRPVVSDIQEALPATLELVFFAALIMTVIGIPLGILAARYRYTFIDRIASLMALLSVATPAFVWAIFFMLLFAFNLGIFPIAGRVSSIATLPETVTGFLLIDSMIGGEWATFMNALSHIVLPALALAMGGLGTAARLTRANMLETYDRPYIQLARAYSFREWEIALKYAFRPAVIPALTILGLDFAIMLGNAFLVEMVFAWPGLARYGVEVILRKDLNGIVGVVLIISTFFLLINLLIDMVVAHLNPKVALEN